MVLPFARMMMAMPMTRCGCCVVGVVCDVQRLGMPACAAAAAPASLMSVQRDTQLWLLPRLGCAGEGAAFCRSSSSRRTQPVAELIVVWMCAGWSSGGCAYAGVPVRTGCGGVRVMGVRVCWRVGLGSRWLTFDKGFSNTPNLQILRRAHVCGLGPVPNIYELHMILRDTFV